MNEKEEQAQDERCLENREQSTSDCINHANSFYIANIEPFCKNKNRHSGEGFYKKSQRKIGIWLNSITAIGTVFLLLTLYYTRQQFQVDQRPYVVVDSKLPNGMQVFLPDKVEDSRRPNMQFNIPIKNIGKTPAINIVYATNSMPYRHDPTPGGQREDTVRIEDSFKDLKLDLRTYGFQSPPEDRRMDFAPNDGITIDGIKSIPAAESNGLLDSTYSMDVVGVIRYMDSFENEYETQFCFTYRKQTGFGEWHPCLVHNIIK